jgi:outer membrane protein TolC
MAGSNATVPEEAVSHSRVVAHEVGPETAAGVGLETTLPTVPPLLEPPANVAAGSRLLAPFESRAASYRGNGALDVMNVDGMAGETAPAEYRGWWEEQVASPVGIGNGHVEVSIDGLIQNALKFSPHIQVAATAPHILNTSVFEESASFDWNSFLESQYVSQDDPVGNTLTTGNDEDRFRQQEWFARGGLSKKTPYGGDLEIVQRLGLLDSNSRFLDPRDQGSSRLELNFRQPILNGRGQAVNQSLIVLADIDSRSASDDFMGELQLHLVAVTESYWELVRSRAVYLQRKRLLESAEKILRYLEGRSKVDSLQRQVLRARAAVAQRKSEIARSLTSIKNAQSQLRLLVNSPDISGAGGMEFMPRDLPLGQMPLDIELADVMSTALMNRPDISRSIRDLHAASVRLGVARNDILPKLDMIVGTYVAGLDGDSDVFQSWARQFKEGSPGFNVGFEYEFAIGNRAARARQQRRQWESTRSLHLFRQTVETSLTEVEVSAREVQTTYQEMLGRYHSMAAAARETSYLVDRWETLPELNDSVTLLLEDMLDSQERLADEESAFVGAQVQYSIAIVQLKQAMGTLFRVGD